MVTPAAHTLSHLAADLIIFILKGNKVVKRTALGGSGGGDKQRGNERGGGVGKKWRGNLEGDEFGQEEMRRRREGGGAGVKRRSGAESKDEANEKGDGWKESLMIRCWLASREMHTYAPDRP